MTIFHTGICEKWMKCSMCILLNLFCIKRQWKLFCILAKVFSYRTSVIWFGGEKCNFFFFPSQSIETLYSQRATSSSINTTGLEEKEVRPGYKTPCSGLSNCLQLKVHVNISRVAQAARTVIRPPRR